MVPATSAQPSALASASTLPSGSAAVEPKAATLDAMFDGPPDASIKMGKPLTFGKATIGLPEGWKAGGAWDSVDTITRTDGAATIVVLRLDISEAYLDSNITTWMRNPFISPEVKWEARTPGKIGVAHLDAKLARGTGKIGKDDAEFFHAAVPGADKKYPLVVIAGVKKSANPSARSEMTAALRSIEWK